MLRKIIIILFLHIVVNPVFLQAQDTSTNTKSFHDNNFNSNALHFDGIDDYVVIPQKNILNPKKITVELWAKSNTENWNSMGSLISKRESYIMHPVFDRKTIQFFIFDEKFSYYVEFIPDIDITQWHHYAATYDGKIINLYIDGQLVSSEKKRRTEKITGKKGDLFIGTDCQMEARYFNGSIDEVRIWNYARTQRNIQRTMNMELLGNEKGLIAYFNFNQGTPFQLNSNETTLKDLTGKNNGKLFNFSLNGHTSNWIKSDVKIFGVNNGNDLITNIFTPINLLILLTFILLVFVYFYIRIRKQKKTQRYLEQQVAEKTKELLEENKIKDALISEIHHRVKNNLQTISSLIYFQLKSTSNEENKNNFKSIQNRVNSMAAIHEMLYSKDDLSFISIKDFITNFVGYIETMITDKDKKVEFNYKIDDIKFNLSDAITLGLMISEIITNAIKYAFENVDNPLILITVKEDINNILLSVKDNGKGIEKDKLSKKQESLGLKLINIFARQLNAEINIKNNNGLEFVFNIKKKNNE